MLKPKISSEACQDGRASNRSHAALKACAIRTAAFAGFGMERATEAELGIQYIAEGVLGNIQPGRFRTGATCADQR